MGVCSDLSEQQFKIKSREEEKIMILKVQKETILRALTASVKALPSKSPLDALLCIKFEATEAGLTLTSSDSDLTLKHFTPADPESLEIQTPGDVLLPGKQLAELVKRFKEGWVTFSLVEGAVLVRNGRSKFTLKATDAAQYPRLIEELQEPKQMITVSQNQLINLFKETLPFTSLQENRPALTAVCLTAKGSSWSCISTDSFRLSRVMIEQPQSVLTEETQVLIPRNSLIEIIKLLPQTKEDKELQLYFYSNQILLKTDHLMICSRLISEAYPNTDAFIPKGFKNLVEINRLELLQVIDRLLLLVDAQDNVCLELNPSTSTLKLRTAQAMGQAEEELSCQGISSALTIWLSGHFLKEAVQSLSGDNIRLCFNGDLNPFILHEVGREESIRLIVPKRM